MKWFLPFILCGCSCSFQIGMGKSEDIKSIIQTVNALVKSNNNLQADVNKLQNSNKPK